MHPFKPTHLSHKPVEAYPLIELRRETPGGFHTAFVEAPIGPVAIAVPENITARGEPEPGSMLVRYKPDERHPDGYMSFSPRDAFDDGYTPVGDYSALAPPTAVEQLFEKLRQILERSGRSREMSVAITHLDTARLWAREHRGA